jgi:heptosyltransferase-1
MSAPKRILIILMGSIGDVTRALPVAAALKQHWPASHLTWLIEPKSLGVVGESACVDEVLLFERGKGFPAFVSAVKRIRAGRFDLALDLQRHFKSGLFSLVSGAARRIGFHPRNSKEGNFLFNTEWIPYREAELSKILHYQEFVRACGATPKEELDFGLKKYAPARFVDRFPNGYVVCVLGASWQTKKWPLSGYQKLLQQICNESNLGVFLIGDKSEFENANKLAALFLNQRVDNLIGKTTLHDVFELCAGARAGVGPDSGPAHIAAAVGKPYVTLVGPTDPLRVAPYGSEQLVISSSVGCSPCWRKVCPGLNTTCMRLISPQSVWEMLSASMKR